MNRRDKFLNALAATLRKKSVWLAAVAIVLCLGSGIGSAMAYFTTYAQAEGSRAIELGERTEIHEEFSNWTKEVTITSAEDSEPVWVRAKAFAGGDFSLTYSDASGKWSAGEDGYYYYSEIVYGGESADTLLVRIDNIPADAKAGDDFNVVVIYEATPVVYDAAGNPLPADWDAKVDVREVSGGEA